MNGVGFSASKNISYDYNFETFGLVEYKQQQTKTLGLYTRVQGLYN
jgi:hypothetical protein